VGRLQDRRRIEPALWKQFHPLEEALAAMGIRVWPVELEADDALASAARSASADERAQKVCIWTPTRTSPSAVRIACRWIAEAAQCGCSRRKAKFGVVPALIPDYLALVGDAADGYPGLSGYGRRARQRCSTSTARSRTSRWILADRRGDALLFKKLATLVADAPVLRNVDELR
jgi:5'-3' exonuclease